jgi:hypothetical protein
VKLTYDSLKTAKANLIQDLNKLPLSRDSLQVEIKDKLFDFSREFILDMYAVRAPGHGCENLESVARLITNTCIDGVEKAR